MIRTHYGSPEYVADVIEQHMQRGWRVRPVTSSEVDPPGDPFGRRHCHFDYDPPAGAYEHDGRWFNIHGRPI